LQDHVEDTAALTRGHEIDKQFIEYLRIFFQGIGKGGPAFDIRLHIGDDFGKGLILFLLGEEIEALDQRKTGVDHRGEDAGKNHDVLFTDLLFQKRKIFA